MNKVTCCSLLVLTIAMSGQAYSQDIFRSAGEKAGGPAGSGQMEAGDNATGTLIPADALVRYSGGDVPFHVVLRSYSRYLNRAVSRDIQSLLAHESTQLGVSGEELELINSLLHRYRTAQDEDWNHAALQACQEILQGSSMDNETAKTRLAELDNRFRQRDEIAMAIMTELRSEVDSTVFAKIESRLLEHGAGVDFTKVNTTTQIELSGAGDYLSHLRSQCAAL